MFIFKRKQEDFICRNCNLRVKGSGFTNHCPQCLWSKHIDINPGDRANLCKGMMEPVGVEMKGSQYVLVHRCLECKQEKRCKVAVDDDMDVVMKISQMMK